jgi:hypothetical protein
MIMGPEGARDQERLYWRGPGAIYRTGLEIIKHGNYTEKC